MKKILNKLPIISICLVFCLTLLLGVFLTLPQSKDVYATEDPEPINWVEFAEDNGPGLYDNEGNEIADWDYILANHWFSDSNNGYLSYSGETSGDVLIVGDVGFSFSHLPWVWSNESFSRIIITNYFNIDGVVDMSYMFAGCAELKEVIFADGIDTKNVVYFNQMFNECSSLENIYFGANWSTASASRMEGMFGGCSSLTSLDLSDWNVSNVERADGMFNNCSKLTNITFGEGWKFESIVLMPFMFAGCSRLESLDLSDWKITSESLCGVEGLFSGCSALSSLNLGSLTFEGVEEIGVMFSGCLSLTNLNLTSFNTSSAELMDRMFAGTNINVLNISSFSFENLTTDEDFDWYGVAGMFGAFSGDQLLEYFGLEEDFGEVFENRKSDFYENTTSFEDELEWILNFFMHHYDYDETKYEWSAYEGISEYDSLSGLEAKLEYAFNIEGYGIPSEIAWFLNFYPTRIQTIIAPAEVPEDMIYLPGNYYFAICNNTTGNLEYVMDDDEYTRYDVLVSYETAFGEEGSLEEGYSFAYLLNRAQTNINGYGSSNVADVAVIGGTNTISSTTTNLTVASARTASGNNQAQAVVANVLDVTGTSGQPVTLKVYCEQNPNLTNNQIILMRHNGSSWTQESCNASYDSTNKVLTVTSTMPANSTSFAVLSAPQGDSPAPSPTPGTGIVTNLTLGFVISGVLAGIVATFAITNKKKKFNNK